jgi:single-strand DNA-binding protein
MSRSLNRAQLIGNLTRDPELRYTPSGTAVCTFTVATNRQWKTDKGDSRDEAEFHRAVAWDKLAEICNQLLKKGRKVFVEGRIQTRKWETKDGQPRTTTEIVISDMVVLDKMGDADSSASSGGGDIEVPEDFEADIDINDDVSSSKGKSKSKRGGGKSKKAKKDDSSEDDDIPF